MKTAEEIIKNHKDTQGKLSAIYWHSSVISAMEEYADQFKKQLKEKEEQLTKSNEMIDRLAEALDIFNRADANSGLQTSILKHNELIFIRKALTEYQNSKK